MNAGGQIPQSIIVVPNNTISVESRKVTSFAQVKSISDVHMLKIEK